MSEKFFGKYRGVVINNVDPQQIGRIQIQVRNLPDGISPTWAMPCAPVNLPRKIGGAIPKIGAGVWIEFEQGDLNHPIWIGCFYGNTAETPAALRSKR